MNTIMALFSLTLAAINIDALVAGTNVFPRIACVGIALLGITGAIRSIVRDEIERATAKRDQPPAENAEAR